jgi:hypothetical protein
MLQANRVVTMMICHDRRKRFIVKKKRHVSCHSTRCKVKALGVKVDEKGLHKGFLFAIVAILLESPGDVDGVDEIWSS